MFYQAKQVLLLMQAYHHSVALKWKLSRKVRLLVFKSILVPILTYGRESWVMTERMRSQMQAFEIIFLRKIKEVTMFDIVHNTVI